MADITAALFLHGKYHTLSIEEFKYSSDFKWTPITVAKLLNEFVAVDFEKLFPVIESPDEILTANSSLKVPICSGVRIMELSLIQLKSWPCHCH